MGLGDKPLWLTEYGALEAWCHEVHPNTNLESGGVRCLEAGGENSNVFYGRNSDEGIWGLQERQMNYLAQPTNQWQVAWWFADTMGDWNNNPDLPCFQTAWLWGSNFDCSQSKSTISTAGYTHCIIMEDIYQQEFCPPPPQQFGLISASSIATPTPTPVEQR